MTKIDLHMHSFYSDDGEFSPAELLCLGKQTQLDYMAITDHNSVNGVSAAKALAAPMGIEVISGIELDCIHKGRSFHLLGYGFDHTNPTFAQIEQNILTQEQNAAKQKVALFRKSTNIPLSADEVFATAKDGIVTGELIAEILLLKENAKEYELLLPYLEGGTRSNNPYVNFYWDFFSEGKPAYVPICYMTLTEGVDLLHATGGIAVLAHPGQNLQADYAFMKQIFETDIDGIEAYSSYHNRDESALFDNMAQQHGLIITCGSDFHGKTKPAISMGEHAGEGVLQRVIEGLKTKGIL